MPQVLFFVSTYASIEVNNTERGVPIITLNTLTAIEFKNSLSFIITPYALKFNTRGNSDSPLFIVSIGSFIDAINTYQNG